MASTTKQPVGQLKSKITVYCSICGCSHTRRLKAFIFENTKAEIEKVKSELSTKGNKKYTCKICKSIEKDI